MKSRTAGGSFLKESLPVAAGNTNYSNSRIITATTWSSENHEYGSCLVNHKKKLLYVQIPKCASTWMKAYISQGSDSRDWSYSNFLRFDHLRYVPVIILRDPVDRWFSTMPGNTLVLDDSTVEFLKQSFNNFKPWLEDEHTTPQSSFIKDLNTSRAVYFKCDERLSENMKKFFSEQKIKHLRPPEYRNVHSTKPEYQILKTMWQNLFAEEKYFKIFKQAYAKDYDLINQVKFYENN